jgi:hypothetical protein
MIAAISIAALLVLVQIYIDIQWVSASGDLARLRGTSAASATQLSSIQGTVDSFRQSLKQYDADIGPQGKIQLLAKGLQDGEAEISVRSLKVLSNGKPVVSLGSAADSGGLVQVVSNDGTGSAEISAAAGKGKLGLKATTGADATLAVHIATYGSDGLYLQKGTTDDMAARSDGAGLQIQDAGANFFMAQNAGGNVSIDTSTAEERAKISIWSDGTPKKVIDLSLGAKDANPFVSLAGEVSGYSMTLVPDRMALANKDGTITLTAAGDDSGGFLIANDKTGDRRAIIASGTDGHGSIGVYGSDGRSNTLFPEYNIQKSSSTQK